MATDTAMMERLEERRTANVGKQVDNASLPAGASMYYYCHGCGTQTAIKPEGWYQNPPKRFCDDCDVLVEAGLISRTEESYDGWLVAHDHKRVPR